MAEVDPSAIEQPTHDGCFGKKVAVHVAENLQEEPRKYSELASSEWAEQASHKNPNHKLGFAGWGLFPIRKSGGSEPSVRIRRRRVVLRSIVRGWDRIRGPVGVRVR